MARYLNLFGHELSDSRSIGKFSSEIKKSLSKLEFFSRSVFKFIYCAYLEFEFLLVA